MTGITFENLIESEVQELEGLRKKVDSATSKEKSKAYQTFKAQYNFYNEVLLDLLRESNINHRPYTERVKNAWKRA
jgi:hypothetical protein